MKSMTGYGRQEIKDNDRHFIVEIKSFNNRFSDISVKMSFEFREIEQEIVKKIKNSVKRGKIEVFIFKGEEDKSDINIFENHNLASNYYRILKTLQKRLDLPDNIDLNMLINFYRVNEITKEKKITVLSEEIKNMLLDAIEKSLKNFDEMREKEGEIIKKDLIQRIKILNDETKKIDKLYKSSLIEHKNNLMKGIKEIAGDVKIDENRLAMEIALIVEKSDVSEEITRMGSHIEQMRETMDSKDSIGRKLDFILQEINRETNTIGSKCNNIEISKSVITLKEELEKIREQVQNVE